MSPRDSFWFLAGALVTVAIVVTLRAWLRERPALAGQPAIPSFAVPIAAALALIGVALGIYFLLGSPDSIASNHAVASQRGSALAVGSAGPSKPMGDSAASAGSLDDVTRKLATRLAAKGGSDSEWKLLAQSYEYMGRTAEAQAAKAHIASATPLAAGNPSSDEPAAQISGEQLAAVADALDKPSAGVSKPTSAVGNAEISGTVEIASKLAPRAAAGATLFIYAKQPNAPGPPLAVLRMRVERWPVTFTLNDANAMVPGRNLSNADSVQIEARISKSGDALARPGDLVGTVTGVNPRDGQPIRISIDREIG
jgi:hypothetical protein